MFSYVAPEAREPERHPWCIAEVLRADLQKVLHLQERAARDVPREMAKAGFATLRRRCPSPRRSRLPDGHAFHSSRRRGIRQDGHAIQV
jgi:hypothetical protein